ncbi:Uncharacterised protein [uncultured Eubacterium sp.]|nr:Uncharacterised protein [uncultured Eubacterium sp.]
MKKIVTLILAFVICFALVSCGSPSPTDVTDSFLKAVKAQDAEEMAKVYAGDDFKVLDDDGEEKEVLGALEKSIMTKFFDFEYKIANEKIDGDKAKVDVTFKTYKMGNAFTAFIGEYFSQALGLAFSGASDKQVEELAETLFTEQLDKLTKKDYTKTVSVSLEKVDDQWKISELDEESDVLNAMSGGLIEAINNTSNAFNDAE